jgi:hypothetical protein
MEQILSSGVSALKGWIVPFAVFASPSRQTKDSIE